MRSLGPLSVLGLAIVLVAAVSASASNPNQEKIRFNAADQAAARTATLKRPDLRPADGWRGGAVKPDLSSALPTCPNYHPDISRFVLTGVAASNWLRGGGGAFKSNVASQTEILETAQMVRGEWQLQVQTPAFVPCMRSFFAQTYTAQGGRLISYEQIPFPKIATYRAAYRIVGEVKKLRLVAEFALIAKARTEIELDLFGPGSAQNSIAAETLRLARILVARVQA